MGIMKRMLMVYPNNFLQGAMGTNNRVMQLVCIFKEIGFQIDYFSFENFSPDSSFKGFEDQNKERLIDELFLYDFQKGYGGQNRKESKMHTVYERMKKKIVRVQSREYLQDWVPSGAQRMFEDIIRQKKYDVVITFYTYLAALFKNQEIQAKKIYFMEDSMFLQQYFWDKDRVEGITLGKLMDEEIARLRYFDEVFCISNDERIFYEKITGKGMHFLPHLLPDDITPVDTPLGDRRWDVFFIGFQNPFNIEGMHWFVNEVYPFLQKGIRILLVGSATKDIEVRYHNIEVISFAPDLEEIYRNVKVAICPMFQGTGMKVKVVEAMSKGLPVVCNERGVDGMPDKNMCGCLVTQDPMQFAEYINELVTDEEFYYKVSCKTREYYQSVFDRRKYVGLLREVFI